MQSGRILAGARRRAGLTQRQLARRAGLPASTVARIEVGAVDPRFGTLTRLLRECGETLSAERLTTGGVDMGQIRNRLLMKPGDRLRASVVATNNVRALLRGASHGGGSDVD